MTKQHFCLLCLSAIMLIFLFSNSAFATEGFQPPIFALHRNPTICAFEPQPDSNFPKLGEKMLTETEYAVLDWQTKLNTGTGTHPLWNMNLLKIPLWQQNSFDSSGCDITINYQPQSNSTITEAGVTHFGSSPIKITIYYLGVIWDVKDKSWISGNSLYHQYTSVLQFTGYFASDPQLQSIIRHELGHSLGLNHYIVSEEKLTTIGRGQEDAPSIMLTNMIGYGVASYGITPADITEVKSIYNNNGFNEFLDTSIVNNLNEPLKQQILSDINTTHAVYPHFLDISSVLKSEKLPVPTCADFLDYSTNQMRTNVSALIIPSWMSNVVKWWAEGLISDQEISASMHYAIHCPSGQPLNN